MHTFSPTRLAIARKRRGLRVKQLAELVGVSARSISAYEAGDMRPSSETLGDISRALGFPIEFFAKPELDELAIDAPSFRALTAMTAAQRDAVTAASRIGIEIVQWIEDQFHLPAADVPDLFELTPEAAAVSLRSSWGLGEKSISNMVHLLEVHGVRVCSLNEASTHVDAFSLWHSKTPFVFLNLQKSAERGRFDAAHELGHLVLHRHGVSQGRKAEEQANAFASAFLMPKGSVLAHAPRLPSSAQIIRLKHTWKVSAMALTRRLYDVGVLSEWLYRQLCIELAEAGWRTHEKDGGPRETSQLMAKVFAALREDKILPHDLARRLSIPAEELEALTFTPAFSALEGGKSVAQTTAPNEPRPRLSVVK